MQLFDYSTFLIRDVAEALQFRKSMHVYKHVKVVLGKYINIQQEIMQGKWKSYNFVYPTILSENKSSSPITHSELCFYGSNFWILRWCIFLPLMYP